tara:strand:- start:377 stop:592 length:216 start_codon:yes stop_codon:yes gene_type:complete
MEKFNGMQQQQRFATQDLAWEGAKGASSVGKSLNAQASCEPGKMMLDKGWWAMVECMSPIHVAPDHGFAMI